MSHIKILISNLPTTKALSLSRILSVFETDGVRVDLGDRTTGGGSTGEIRNASDDVIRIVTAGGSALHTIAVGETVLIPNLGVLCDKKGFLFVNAAHALNCVTTTVPDLNFNGVTSRLNASQSNRHFEWAHNVCVSSGVISPDAIGTWIKEKRKTQVKVSDVALQTGVANLLQSKFEAANSVFQSRIEASLRTKFGAGVGLNTRIPVLGFVTNPQVKTTVSNKLTQRGDLVSLHILNELRVIDGELLARMG